MDRKNHNLRTVIEKSYDSLKLDTLSQPSRRLRMLASLFDVSAAVDFLNMELENLKKKYNPYIDKDFDFDTMIPRSPIIGNEELYPVLDEMKTHEFTDKARDVVSVSSYYFPTLSDDEIANMQRTSEALFAEEKKKKERNENFKKALISIERGENVSDYEILEALRRGYDELINILYDIKEEITSSKNAQEKGEALYNELSNQYLPQGFTGMWKCFQEYRKWEDDSFIEITPELRRDFVAIKLQGVLDTFIVDDKDHELPSNSRKYSDEFKDLFNEHGNGRCGRAKYATLRAFMSYDNGLLFVSDPAKLGKYIFKNRKRLVRDNIENFFDFIGLNIIIADAEHNEKEIKPKEQKPAVIHNGYPEVEDGHKSFLEEKIYWEVNNKKRWIKIPKDDILHIIYDFLHEHIEDENKIDTRVCRIVYMVVVVLKITIKQQREVYSKFANSIIKYAYSNHNITKLAGNIAKVEINSDYEQMDESDKIIYRALHSQIKTALDNTFKSDCSSVKQ